MRNVLLIAKREYLEKIRGRAFKLSTVLVPLLVAIMVGWSSYSSRNADSGRHIAVAADNAMLAETVRNELLSDKEARYTVDVIAPATAADRAAQLQRIQTKTIDGLLWIENSSSATPSVTYSSQSSADLMDTSRLRTALSRGLAEKRLMDQGKNQAEADAVLKNVAIETQQINKDGSVGKGSGMAPFFKSMMLAVLMTMPILLYGLDMARAIVEEKSSRIFEVMLSVARADDILTGKLIGVGAVGLTQIAIWVTAGALFAGSALAATVLTGDLSIHFAWQEVVFFPVYFVMGFFLYSCFFSGLAATCETAQDLQMYVPLAMIPTWISFGILPFLLSDPSSFWAIAASLFPPTAPFVMLPRMGLTAVPAWQLAASLVLLAVSIWAVLWFAARLYRIGILMYGKRATLPELLRWLRYSS